MTARSLLSAMAFALATGETPKNSDWYPDPRSFEKALDDYRAEVLREAAALGRELSRQGYSAQEIATQLDRMADAATPTSGHSCGNCGGIDPDSCLMNPERTAPTSKEQQR